jgi:hypothetical protein
MLQLPCQFSAGRRYFIESKIDHFIDVNLLLLNIL